MKIIHLIILLVFCINLNAQTNIKQKFEKQFEAKIFVDSKNDTLPYRMIVPKNVKADKILLYLHGAGERGNDNYSQLQFVDSIFCDSNFLNLGAIVILPQCQKDYRWCEVDWTLLSHTMPKEISRYLFAANELVDSLSKQLEINKLYVCGISMGGFGTWDLISRYPNKFLAAMPICGGADLNMAQALKNQRIMIFHGAMDKLVKVSRSRNMYQELKNVGNTLVTYKEYPKAGHFVWNPVFRNLNNFKLLFANQD